MLPRTTASVLLLLLAPPFVRAQPPADLLARLYVPGEHTRAVVECRRLGPAAAAALVDALTRPDCREPHMLAGVLGELGDATRADVARITEMLPGRPEPQRTRLLRALANGVLGCTDEQAIEALRDQLGAWARAGFFYSESAKQPSFAWYEYVRLRRRLSLRERGTRPEDLVEALDTIRKSREGMSLLLAALDKKSRVHDLTSFGQHATREDLEAIAELALAHGPAARTVVDELAKYLRHEPPRPGETRREPFAGIGENPPANLPSQQFPTLWRRDDWRFAIARSVAAISQRQADRLHALRHLLHAPGVADRLDALAAARDWPQPWNELAPDLAACLDAADRLVVRDALVTFGLAQQLTLPRPRLEQLARADDKELATLADRLLRQ
ncbi:MAG TPA: hypothetical protein VF384_14330 [Planctomycetota bacterium]